jgi:thiol:disulfide interchange protein
MAPRSGGGVSFDAAQEPLAQVLAESGRAGRPPMLYFLAGWCGWCSKMSRETLPDPRLGRHMAGFYNVRVDPDTPDGRALATRYGVNGFPTLVRLDASGNAVSRMEGFRSADDLIATVHAP